MFRKKMFTFSSWVMPFSLLLLLGVACYSNALHNGFMMDDYNYFFDHPTVSDVSFKEIFAQGFKHFYRPLAVVLSKAEWALFGASPAGYHIFNLSILVLISFFFFILFRRLLQKPLLAFLAACLYLAHPINNFLVNYKTACHLGVSTLMLQISMLLFLEYLDFRRVRDYILSLLLFSCALFFHEINFFLPVYLFLVLYFLKDYSPKKAFGLCWPYGVPFVIYSLLRLNIQEAVEIHNVFQIGIPVYKYFFTLIYLTKWYLSRLVIPVDILFLWSETIKDYLTPMVWVGFIGAVLVVVMLFLRWKKDKKSFFLVTFLVGFLPTYLASFTYTAASRTSIIEPHWFLFSSIGFFLLVASGLAVLKERVSKTIWFVFVIFLVVTLGFLTRQTNRAWKNQITYSDYWIHLNPINETPWDELARVTFDAQKAGKPVFILQKFDGFLKEQNSYLAYAKRARGYFISNQYDLALADYSNSLALNPDYDIAYNNRGMIYKAQGKLDLALKDFDAVLKINPLAAKVYNNRGMIYYQQGKMDLALADYSHAIKLKKDLGPAYQNRAILFALMKDFRRALQDALDAKKHGVQGNEKFIQNLKQSMSITAMPESVR
ncbi:MAG: tetratricopeptide repeat protein [Candidatus Omnitrophica bacterium]|nr:tetratricopeptide repeat protein [Candidatus Omnitrophota bacterium]